MTDQPLNSDFLKWSIDARKSVQLAMLNLAACYEEPNYLAAQDFARRFTELTGITFSLWRAAFLVSLETMPRTDDRLPDQKNERKSRAQVDHAADLLRTILSSNAVTFGDDRRTQSWMGLYYIDNAAFRLNRYLDHHGQQTEGASVGQFRQYHRGDQNPSDYAAGAYAWNMIFNLSEHEISRLLDDLKRRAPVVIAPMNQQNYKFPARPADLGEFLVEATAEVRDA